MVGVGVDDVEGALFPVLVLGWPGGLLAGVLRGLLQPRTKVVLATVSIGSSDAAVAACWNRLFADRASEPSVGNRDELMIAMLVTLEQDDRGRSRVCAATRR